VSTPGEGGQGWPDENPTGMQVDDGTDGVIDDQVEERPESAAALFGDRLDAADRYAQHLATTGVE
jgi:16S rRNA (guanine527-N7)-methyltransferase